MGCLEEPAELGVKVSLASFCGVAYGRVESMLGIFVWVVFLVGWAVGMLWVCWGLRWVRVALCLPAAWWGWGSLLALPSCWCAMGPCDTTL